MDRKKCAVSRLRTKAKKATSRRRRGMRLPEATGGVLPRREALLAWINAEVAPLLESKLELSEEDPVTEIVQKLTHASPASLSRVVAWCYVLRSRYVPGTGSRGVVGAGVSGGVPGGDSDHLAPEGVK